MDTSTAAAWTLAALEFAGLSFAIYKWRHAEARAMAAEHRQERLALVAQQLAAAQGSAVAVAQAQLEHNRRMDLVDLILEMTDRT